MASLELISKDASGNLVKKTVTSGVGLLVSYAGNDSPKHTLLCNGAAISRTVYPELFAVIGITYGAGDGSTTFNLPDYSGRCIQGSQTAGTVKEAGLPNIVGQLGHLSSTNANATCSGALSWIMLGSTVLASDAATVKVDVKFDASLSNGIYGASNTVQPPAVTARICIIYE